MPMRFFDNDSILHQYWIFRPGSNSDAIEGDLNSAHFSAATGRTTFGPETDPTRCTLSVNNLTLGYYIVKVTHLDGTANVVKFVKE